MKASYRLFVVMLFAAFTVSSALADSSSNGTLAGTGLDQRVNSGARVVLRGAGWTNSGRVVRFDWRQVDGTGVRLRDANRSTAYFIAPDVKSTAVLKFQLTVTDLHGGTGSNVVSITVEPKGRSLASNTPSEDKPVPASR